MANRLLPYIFMYGRCEEALEFYKATFGGSYEMMRVSDSPMAAQMPGAGNRIMHASFTSGAIAFYASDGEGDKKIDPDAGNVSLALNFEDGPGGEKVFHSLSAGGTVKMPLAEAFWGGRFGMVVDTFGNEWMVSLP